MGRCGEDNAYIREYIQLQTGIEIPFFKGVLSTMQDMHHWNDLYIGERFNLAELKN